MICSKIWRIKNDSMTGVVMAREAWKNLGGNLKSSFYDSNEKDRRKQEKK